MFLIPPLVHLCTLHSCGTVTHGAEEMDMFPIWVVLPLMVGVPEGKFGELCETEDACVCAVV